MKKIIILISLPLFILVGVSVYSKAPTPYTIKQIGKSAPCRHPIPVQVGTLIRNMPAGDSGASRQVFCDLAE
jgi:hypothetical protein